MSKVTTTAKYAFPVAGGALVIAVQTPPDIAKANAAKWVREASGYLPNWPPWVDALATVVGILLLLTPLWLRLWRSGWFETHVLWRFRLRPPSVARPSASSAAKPTLEIRPPLLRSGPTAEELAQTLKEEQERAILRLSAALPADRPAQPKPQPSDGFDYSYPKAVMQARIQKEVGTLEQRGDEPELLSIVMTVDNKHTTSLFDCSVVVTGLTCPDGEVVSLNVPFVNAENFNLHPRQPRNLPIVTRDISDKVTPSPFLLRTQGSGVPLKENSRYFAHVELRCRYPYPTQLVIQIETQTALSARCAIIRQAIAQESKQ
jgi:hypothetical protein